jgi:hypothetical protein
MPSSYCLLLKPRGRGIRCLAGFSPLRRVDERPVHCWFGWCWCFGERNGLKFCSEVVDLG